MEKNWGGETSNQNLAIDFDFEGRCNVRGRGEKQGPHHKK